MMRLFRVALLLLLLSCRHGSRVHAAAKAKSQLLLLQVLDSHGLRDALRFVTHTALSPSFFELTEVRVLISKAHFQSADKDAQQGATNSSRFSMHHYTREESLPDRSIGKESRIEERVTFLLDGLNQSLALDTSVGVPPAPPRQIVSVAFKKGTVAHPLPNFTALFSFGTPAIPKRAASGTSVGGRSSAADVLLLGKNRRLSSVSDWHDLSVVRLSATDATRRWLSTVIDVYYHHADREAFSLLEPRPALLEATARARAGGSALVVGYFAKGQLCRVHTVSTGKAAEQGLAMDHCLSLQSFLALECSEATQDKAEGYSPCHQLDEPLHWKTKIDRGVVSSFAERSPFLKPDQWASKLHEAIWTGSLRYRDPLDAATPRAWCWETNTTTDGRRKPPEQRAQSRIYQDFNTSRPYVHPPLSDAGADAGAGGGSGKLKVVIMTGSQASASALEAKLFLQLSKQMYCKRHGYTFYQPLSNQFTAFFPLDLYASIRAEMSHTAYFRGLMSKTLMMADALLRHPHADWVIWTDDDVYINTGWLYLSMDAFLKDVPKDKVYVQANYRSAFTNVFAVRNSEQGRRLVYDWIAVAMSGHVQCHGFDQAAIGTLLLTRVYGMGKADPAASSTSSTSSSSSKSRVAYNPFPFNHTCTWSDAGFTGCNNKGDWSCDFKLEASLYRAGFKTRLANFFGQKVSSYTKGCANHVIPGKPPVLLLHPASDFASLRKAIPTCPFSPATSNVSNPPIPTPHACTRQRLPCAVRDRLPAPLAVRPLHPALRDRVMRALGRPAGRRQRPHPTRGDKRLVLQPQGRVPLLRVLSRPEQVQLRRRRHPALPTAWRRGRRRERERCAGGAGRGRGTRAPSRSL